MDRLSYGQYKPGIGTEARYEEINEVNEGTIDYPTL